MQSGMIRRLAISLWIPLSICLAGKESRHAEVLEGAAHSTRAPHGLTQLFGLPIITGAGLTQIYQQNTHGGLSTGNRTGRYSGSYHLEASVDLQKSLGLADSTMYVLLEGGWPSAGSIDPAAIGSHFGVNGDAIQGEWIDVAEFWYLRSFAEDRLFVQVGKADLTAGMEYRNVLSAFDLNAYANDETTQFLNGALVNNPTIPFPAYSLAASAVAKPWAHWQFAAAGATQTSDADIDETASWASDREGFFLIFQASHLPETWAAGAYHIGAWWSGGESTGVYFSANQDIFREDRDPRNEQGLGLFWRIGLTDGKPADLRSFWSIGLQYTGLLESRDADVLGLGYANGQFTDTGDHEALRGDEQVVELYYRVPLTRRVSLSPNAQYVADSGGQTGADDATVFALRAQILLE